MGHVNLDVDMVEESTDPYTQQSIAIDSRETSIVMDGRHITPATVIGRESSIDTVSQGDPYAGQAPVNSIAVSGRETSIATSGRDFVTVDGRESSIDTVSQEFHLHSEATAQSTPKQNDTCIKLSKTMIVNALAIHKSTGAPFNHVISDSGASQHLIPLHVKCDNIQPLPNDASIRVASGTRLRSTTSGEIRIGSIKVRALRVEGLCVPLISVGRLAKRGYLTLFLPEHGIVLDSKTGEKVATLIKRDGLYVFEDPLELCPSEAITPSTEAFQATRSETSDIEEHEFWGHPGKNKLQTILGRRVNVPPCEDCAKGKMQAKAHRTRASPKMGAIHAYEPLSSLHIDTVEFARGKYMMVIVDEVSRYMWTITAPKKSLLIHPLRQLLAQLDRQHKIR